MTRLRIRYTTWLMPVPRWLARRWLGWHAPVYSGEPPF